MSVWDTFSIDESIRIGKFWAVTWPSPVLEILKVSVSDTFSIHFFLYVIKIESFAVAQGYGKQKVV